MADTCPRCRYYRVGYAQLANRCQRCGELIHHDTAYQCNIDESFGEDRTILTTFDAQLRKSLGSIELRPIDRSRPCPCGCGQTIAEMVATAPEIDDA